MSAALKPREAAVASVSMEYPRDAFQRILDCMSLDSQELGDPLQRLAPNAHRVAGNGPQIPVRDPSDSRRNPASANPTPMNPNASRSHTVPRIETHICEHHCSLFSNKITFRDCIASEICHDDRQFHGNMQLTSYTNFYCHHPFSL